MVIKKSIYGKISFLRPIWPLALTVFILIVTFMFLICQGFTGSSIGLGLRGSDIIEYKDSFLFGSKPQDIRSDEWLVFTPMAIGQTNHEPRFPIINKNLGPDGQNMLVVGMTGVPVAHISNLAKPATWGFYFLNLRQALAWYWWLPIFGSIFSIWGLIQINFKLEWPLSLGLSSLIVFSPYMTAWSYWPAYTLMFPSLALLSLVKILSKKVSYFSIIWFFLLILSTTGFFFILYPAWQIPLAYLYLIMFVAIYIRDQLWEKGSLGKYFMILLAGIICFYIIFCWWIDAKEAILSIKNTVYPGQRSEIQGGDLPGWFYVKGLLSSWSMYNDLPHTNKSESASFYYFFIPSIFIYLCSLKNRCKSLILPTGILIFTVFVIVYCNYGFSLDFTKYTFWGRSTPKRADISLGLAQVFFLASMISHFAIHQINISPLIQKVVAWGVALLSAVLVIYWTSLLPAEWLSYHGFVYAFGLAVLITAFGSYFLLLRSFGKFILLVLSINLVVALTFNPIYKSPKELLVKNNLENGLFEDGRTLVLGSQVPAMMLFASGAKILNGISYSPQWSLWEVLDPSLSSANLYNRYQHLLFVNGDLPNDLLYEISSPQLDVVVVALSLVMFNFNDLPIKHVLGSSSDDPLLRQNGSLVYTGSISNMSLFTVSDSAD